MLTVTDFYAESAWGLSFGASGSAYTIVSGRHIGQDIVRTGDVPALLGGTVTAVLLTSAMAWCVEVLTADGVRLTYCHLANDNLPTVGQVLAQGDRVGRLAKGPTSLPLRDPDFPGTAWTGMHLHLVCSRIARAAWTIAAGRTLADFIDPTIIIRSVLTGTASGDAHPFEEDDMYDQAARDELMRELEIIRPIKMYALVDDSGAGGWVWVGPSGRWWIVPSAAYAALVAAEGLSQSRPIRAIQQNEFDFMTKQLLGGLVPDSKTDYKPEAQLEHILTLDDASVQKIAASIGEIPVTLSPAQLDAIATAVAGKTADEVKTAISSLSFVVKTS